jgi:hypothetical protein
MTCPSIVVILYKSFVLYVRTYCVLHKIALANNTPAVYILTPTRTLTDCVVLKNDENESLQGEIVLHVTTLHTPVS